MTDQTERWWTPRTDDEPTAEYLGRILDELGATDLAAAARRFDYDDYRCEHPDDCGNNIHRLVVDLDAWALANRQPRRARVVRAAAIDGEFDGTKAEAAAWAESPDGRATFAELFRSRPGGAP